MGKELLDKLIPSETLGSIVKINKMKEKGIDVISFGAGEPDFPTPEFIKREAEKALREDFTKYTPTSGINELKEAIVNKLKNENELDYGMKNIIVSNGAKHSLFNICYALCSVGSEVLLPVPYWVSYPDMVYAAGGTPVYVEVESKDSFKVKPSDLDKYKTDKTIALMINSPNNPTGKVYSYDELCALGEWAYKNNVWVISDEIYEKIVFNGHKHYSIVTVYPQIKDRAFIVNGMSKAYSMTGWRIGYAAGPEAEVKQMVLFQSHTTSCPNSIAQKAAIAALKGDGEAVRMMVKTFERRRDLIYNLVKDIKGLKTEKPEGAFYIMIDCRGILNGKPINDFRDFLLDNAHILVIGGEAFGIDGYIRLSFATSDELIVEGIKRLKEGVEQWIAS